MAAGHWFSSTYEPEHRAETAYSALFPANFRPRISTGKNSRAAWAGVQQLQRPQTKDGITQQENQFSA